MHGFNWFDRRGTEGVGFVRALRTLLTNNIPFILSDLKVAIATNFAQIYAEHQVVNGEYLMIEPRRNFTDQASVGSKHSPVYPMIVKLTVIANALAFFGKDLGDSMLTKLFYEIREADSLTPSTKRDIHALCPRLHRRHPQNGRNCTLAT